MTPASPALQCLTERGLLYRCTDLSGLDATLNTSRVAAAMRIDGEPHLGHLAQLMVLRWMQAHGHKPVILLRGLTSEHGQSITPPLIARLPRILQHLLRFGPGATDAVVLDAAQWRDGLRERARWQPLSGQMHPPHQLTLDHPKESVLVDEISEALDALEVVRRYGAVLRVAALDEEDPVSRGLALARQLGGEQLFGMATVLPVAAPGLRLGPVLGPAVPLNPERLSPGDFARLWLEADINDVARFMRLFTELPLTDIGAAMQRHSKQGRNVREVLGEAIANLLHGSTSGAMRFGYGYQSDPSEPVRRVA